MPVGGRGGSRVNFSCSDSQAHRFEAQIEDGSIDFPNSESLGIGGRKVNFFPSQGRHPPLHALANEALLQPQYGLEGDGLQL